jgi:hypothetical protein
VIQDLATLLEMEIAKDGASNEASYFVPMWYASRSFSQTSSI